MAPAAPDEPTSLAPVAAYPRRALEQYLADAAGAVARLRADLAEAERRRVGAEGAIAAASEGHRLLGAMMVSAQQDLTARRSHAADAAASLLADAEAEAARIVAAARAQATALVGGLPPALDDPAPDEPTGVGWLPRSRRSGSGFDWHDDREGDDGFFTRLRDELHADGSLGTWFETA
jgi:hypothetical protein